MNLFWFIARPPKNLVHVHEFEFQFYTGNYNTVSTHNGVAYRGVTELYRCKCGKQAIRHTGMNEKVEI